VLLIAECLDDCHLRMLHNEAVELGMTPLVELYEEQNLPRVLEAGAVLVGINNRNLRTFEVDLQHTIRLRPQIPAGVIVVGESGIHCREDALLLQNAGVHAMLVGERLMADADVGAAVRILLGSSNERQVAPRVDT
jgi:indole-3-glycerol phosphate synthase